MSSRKNSKNNMSDDYGYQDLDFEERNYMQSALFDFDTNSRSRNYYNNGYDNNPYITEGNDYFNNAYEYVDVEYSYEDASKYGGYYFDDAQYSNAYNESSFTGYDNNMYGGYYNNGYAGSEAIANQYIDSQASYEQAMHSTSVVGDVNSALINSNNMVDSMDDDVITMQMRDALSGNVEQQNYDDIRQNASYSTDVYYAMDYANDDDSYEQQRQVPALKYNNIPTQNIQFEESFLVDSAMFEDDEEKIISWKDVITLAVSVVMVFIAAILITTYGIQHMEVEGYAMDFNLNNEDIVLLDKFSYRVNKPKRYDVVVFKNGSGYDMKRIIGLPNETVRVDTDGKVYINDKEKKDDIYGYAPTLEKGCDAVSLGKDEYFVLGDNRNSSTDSRMNSPVKKSSILGKVTFRIFPFNSFGSIPTKINEKIKNGDTEKAKDGEYRANDVEAIKADKIDGNIEKEEKSSEESSEESTENSKEDDGE